MSARDVLLLAAQKVERGWTQGAYARDASGASVSAFSAAAVCFCARGAVRAACPAGLFSDALTGAGYRWEAMAALRAVTGFASALWNDHPFRTQAEVVSALRAAAERVR